MDLDEAKHKLGVIRPHGFRRGRFFVDEVRDLFGEFYDEREHSQKDSERRTKIEQHLNTAIEGFYRNLEKTLLHINEVLPTLDVVAYPSRRWQKGKTLEQIELDQRVEGIAKLRDENLRDIKAEVKGYGRP